MVERQGLLAETQSRIRARHMSFRTEKTYLHWIRRYIRYHGRRHPREMGGREVEEFLTDLAVGNKVSASTQNQALAAILFLYREVLEIDLPWLEDLIRAKRPQRLPVVLSPRARIRSARLLGHADLKTTMIYTHVLNKGGRSVRSPLDKA